MSGQKDINNENPSQKDENLITEKMIKKVTYLVHKLADRRGAQYEDILKKCKKMFAYTNLAKVSLVDGHAIIKKLIDMTGGEEEEQTAEKDDLSPQKEEIKEGEDNSEVEKAIEKEAGNLREEDKKAQEDEDLVISTMRQSIRAAVDITNNEIVAKEIPVMGLGGVVLEIGKIIFNAKMAEEANEDEQ